MRYGIFSDIHSNLEAFDAVLSAFSKESIDVYLCAGDIVGYAANPVECVRRFRELSCVSVIGNHDAAAAGVIDTDNFNPLARRAVSWTRDIISDDDKKFLSSLPYVYQNDDIVMVHGTLDNPERFDYLLDTVVAKETFERMKRSVCFIGHSHVPVVFIRGGEEIDCIDNARITISHQKRYIVNVGSVGQPRDNDPRSAYCVYDTDSGLLEIKRVAYDIKKVQGEILNAGLPVLLASRLAEGT